MKGLLQLIGVIIVTAFGMALTTRYQAGSLDSQTVLLGYPVVSIAQVGAAGWLSIGQVGYGVLVLAQGGAGVVLIGQGGVGLVFGLGQAAFGLAAIAQVGVGAFFFVGQLGVGAQAGGQLVALRKSKAYFKEMSAELTEVLRLPPLLLGKR